MTENPKAKLDEFFLHKKIEEGGMSEIFLAMDSNDQEWVIKKLKKEFSYDKSFIKLLASEVETLQSLEHPHILKAKKFKSEGENTYAVLEYVPGITLRQIIDYHDHAHNNIPLKIALDIILQLTQTLEYIHGAQDSSGKTLGIIHSDLNPRNIIINSEGHLKLIDFSIAQTNENKVGDTEGVGRGVINYMSPEQAKSEPIDARSDLFSVGILLYEMLVGEMPFAGKSRFEVYRNLLSREIQQEMFPKELPPPVIHLIMQCLSKEKEKRYQSASQLKSAIEDCQRNLPSEIAGLKIKEYLSNLLKNLQ